MDNPLVAPVNYPLIKCPLSGGYFLFSCPKIKITIMQPTLLILAAGMASRYGSMKQIQGFGPSGETIMDYSIYDAIRAGFGKVVFIIRKDFAENFKNIFEPKLKGRVAVDYVYRICTPLRVILPCLPKGQSPGERLMPCFVQRMRSGNPLPSSMPTIFMVATPL